MKSQAFVLQKFEADEGMVFDWATPRFVEDVDGNTIQEHLYAKTIYLSLGDNISNYIEVPLPKEE